MCATMYGIQMHPTLKHRKLNAPCDLQLTASSVREYSLKSRKIELITWECSYTCWHCTDWIQEVGSRGAGGWQEGGDGGQGGGAGGDGIKIINWVIHNA